MSTLGGGMALVAMGITYHGKKACLFDAMIYLARNRQDAMRKFHSFAGIWSEVEPKAVKCIEKDLDTLLPFSDCPEAH